MEEPYILTVLYSPEDAALLHAAHDAYGVWMSLGEIKLRQEAERYGLTHLLVSPTRTPG